MDTHDDDRDPATSSNGASDLALDELRRRKILLECKYLERQLEELSRERTFLASLRSQLEQKFLTVVIPILVVVLTFVSTLGVEKIKRSIEHSQERNQIFGEISGELGQFTFATELMCEWYSKNRTSKAELTPVVNKYNEAIIRLREGAVARRAQVESYWGSGLAGQFDAVMDEVKKVDAAAHGLNEETGKVVRGEKERADAAIAGEVAENIENRLRSLKSSADAFVAALAPGTSR